MIPNFDASLPVFFRDRKLVNMACIRPSGGLMLLGRSKRFRAKLFCLCNGSYFLAAGRFYQLSVLYSEDVELLLLLRWTEWLRRSPLLLCRLLLSFAGRPCITPLRASIPPLTEKLRQTMKALIAAFS